MLQDDQVEETEEKSVKRTEPLFKIEDTSKQSDKPVSAQKNNPTEWEVCNFSIT